MKATITIALFGFILVGCAVQERAELAGRAQTEMIGMTEKNLLICAGVPLRQQKVDDLELLSYSGGGDNVGGGNGGKSAHRYCDATVIIKDGTVQKINYQGRTGGVFTKGEQCAFIFENCVKN